MNFDINLNTKSHQLLGAAYIIQRLTYLPKIGAGAHTSSSFPELTLSSHSQTHTGGDAAPRYLMRSILRSRLSANKTFCFVEMFSAGHFSKCTFAAVELKSMRLSQSEILSLCGIQKGEINTCASARALSYGQM